METSNRDVPVVVDDVKRIPDFRMTRFIYFSVACDEPAPGWTLTLRELELPFLLLGLSGIVLSPPGDRSEFLEPADFDSLVDMIEKHAHLYLDINDIWLPNDSLPADRAIRGAVYRIGQELFADAFEFRNDLVSDKAFSAISKDRREQVSYSEQETRAFRLWTQQQIAGAKANYEEKESEFALVYDEDEAWPSKEE